jgi:hypothetical protein
MTGNIKLLQHFTRCLRGSDRQSAFRADEHLWSHYCGGITYLLCFLSGAEFNLGKVACLCVVVGVFVALEELHYAQSRARVNYTLICWDGARHIPPAAFKTKMIFGLSLNRGDPVIVVGLIYEQNQHSNRLSQHPQHQSALAHAAFLFFEPAAAVAFRALSLGR